MSSVAKIEELLKSHLEASHLSIVDTSGSCGSAFEILFCVSPSFHGKNSLTKQRLVTKALEKEMDKIHALSMKKLISPEEYANLSPRSRSPSPTPISSPAIRYKPPSLVRYFSASS